MIYLTRILECQHTPHLLKKQLHSHFFKPYPDINAFGLGMFYPLEAIFEETLPSLVVSLHFIGQMCLSFSATIGFLLLGKTQEMRQESREMMNALMIAGLAAFLALIAPLVETVRFFTRWAGSIKHSLQEKTPETDYKTTINI